MLKKIEGANPVVSIIMPVYNAEATVGRMVESILNQTFTDWELIAVDDGSTDRSGAILDGYAARDERVRVLHKSNGGVAAARQDGVDHASGIYTIHADSDDWVEPQMLADMVARAMDTGADIVIVDYYVASHDCASQRICQRAASLMPLEVLRAIYAKDLFGGLCHKLIKKSVYDKGAVRFEPGINYCEDQLVLTRMLLNASPAIAYLDGAYYHYMENASSLTRHVTVAGYESLSRFHAVAAELLSRHAGFEDVVRGFAVDEFIDYFMNRLYSSRADLLAHYCKARPAMRGRFGLRWRLGLLCIRAGLLAPAHKLIKY